MLGTDNTLHFPYPTRTHRRLQVAGYMRLIYWL